MLHGFSVPMPETDWGKRLFGIFFVVMFFAFVGTCVGVPIYLVVENPTIGDMSGSTYRSATAIESAEYIGISETTTYPLTIGAITDKTTPIEANLFLGSGTITGPDNKEYLRIGVTVDGLSYTRYIATDDIVYRPVEGVEVSIAFDLIDTDTPNLGEWKDGEFFPSPDLEEMTAISFIDQFAVGATITLTPEEHSRILQGK